MSKIKTEDIAEKSGCSLATVSRYFNKPELLSDRTKEKIETVIKELNYNQNNLARMLKTGKSEFVGIIFPHLQLGFYSELLNQLIEQGKSLGYKFIVYTSNDSKDSELQLINDLISYNIKGLILLSHLLDSSEIEELSIPVITIERAGGNFMQIESDNFTGGKLAGELLIKKTCDVFIHINNDYLEELPSFNRILGFEFIVKNYPYELIIEKKLSLPHSIEAEKAMNLLLTNLLEKYPDKKIGIFCSNDDIANLVLKYSIKNSIAIPERIEIIGYDNSPVSDYAPFPITSIEQNIPLMAQIALESLDNYKAYKSIVPAKLIEKETTS
ncbi:LacI family DNA-binding transcriptional regulator [uncultured Clostridium sp.]|uniref:LacI family DNA-binding transcriptional regulator n=1 Tax=uncultured Clostridium sp. TaxID=59620 RepID=UPI0028E7B533|nr:LacI family DNA-binding transcriptional regulator [uncultured Clostridium sp.]